jgi:hypothetical protein
MEPAIITVSVRPNLTVDSLRRALGYCDYAGKQEYFACLEKNPAQLASCKPRRSIDASCFKSESPRVRMILNHSAQ